MTIQEAVELYTNITNRIEKIKATKNDILNRCLTDPVKISTDKRYIMREEEKDFLFTCLDAYMCDLRCKLQEEFNIPYTLEDNHESNREG